LQALQADPTADISNTRKIHSLNWMGPFSIVLLCSMHTDEANSSMPELLATDCEVSAAQPGCGLVTPQSELRRPLRDTVRSNFFNVAREYAADSRS